MIEFITYFRKWIIWYILICIVLTIWKRPDLIVHTGWFIIVVVVGFEIVTNIIEGKFYGKKISN